ncbi:acyl-CoA dehydrogenase family protein [Micromonospora echinospora]
MANRLREASAAAGRKPPPATGAALGRTGGRCHTGRHAAASLRARPRRVFNAGRLTVVDAAKAKWWTTELQNRVADRCLQLHGGYGYMLEYPVAKAWLDGRVQTIYGGTTEIMKEIIGRGLDL